MDGLGGLGERGRGEERRKVEEEEEGKEGQRPGSGRRWTLRKRGGQGAKEQRTRRRAFREHLLSVPWHHQKFTAQVLLSVGVTDVQALSQSSQRRGGP